MHLQNVFTFPFAPHRAFQRIFIKQKMLQSFLTSPAFLYIWKFVLPFCILYLNMRLILVTRFSSENICTYLKVYCIYFIVFLPLLNYYLGLSNGPPCCHLPQCFPHNNWCPPWDMGVGGTDGQNESHPSQIYIYDCANMHWETAEKLFCEISTNMFFITFKIESR